MPLHRLAPSLLVLAALAGACASAHAAPRQGQQARPQAQAAARGPAEHRRSEDALSDSIRKVEQDTHGQVLSAERVPYDGRSINRIKVVDPQGRVRVYMDDPRSQGSGDAAPPRRPANRGQGRAKGKPSTRRDDG